MAFFANKKFFIFALLFLGIVGSGLFQMSHSFKEHANDIFFESGPGNEERKNLWHINIEMFHDHPWIGVGFNQNQNLSQTYFDKLQIKDSKPSDAHSTYLQLLATTGLAGFLFYMLLILVFILMTARLFAMIPATHYWHRVFALSALGSQVAFHLGSLTFWNLGDIAVELHFFFWLAVVGYMSQDTFCTSSLMITVSKG